MNFGSSQIGVATTPPQNLTISNTGGVAVNLQVPTATGDFAIVANTCAASLAPNFGCTVALAFTPTASGQSNGDLLHHRRCRHADGNSGRHRSCAGDRHHQPNGALLSGPGGWHRERRPGGHAHQFGRLPAHLDIRFGEGRFPGSERLRQLACRPRKLLRHRDLRANPGRPRDRDAHHRRHVWPSADGCLDRLRLGSGGNLGAADDDQFRSLGRFRNQPRAGGDRHQQRRRPARMHLPWRPPETLPPPAATTCPLSPSPNTLAPGASCTVQVVFSPTQSGPLAGNLTIASSPPTPSFQIALSGNGLGFYTFAAQGASSVTIASGQTASYMLQITPSAGSAGPLALTCGAAPREFDLHRQPGVGAANQRSHGLRRGDHRDRRRMPALHGESRRTGSMLFAASLLPRRAGPARISANPPQSFAVGRPGFRCPHPVELRSHFHRWRFIGLVTHQQSRQHAFGYL